MADSNLPGSGLNSLYNTGVQSAEWMTRPKSSMPGQAPHWFPVSHSGVRVTLDDGQKFLIHKGPGYGQSSQTVVTDAANMSSAWQVKETRDVGGTNTVGDFVEAGGENYSLWKGQHCHRAAKDMMNQK